MSKQRKFHVKQIKKKFYLFRKIRIRLCSSPMGSLTSSSRASLNPKSTVALFNLRKSSTPLGPCIIKLRPLFESRGKDNFKNRSTEPKARVTTSSNDPTSFVFSSSALFSMICTPLIFSLRVSSRRKLVFFRCDSTKTTSFSGRTILRGKPGNPAPLPISRSLPVDDKKGRIASESRKWRLTTRPGSLMEVRLNLLPH